MREDTFVFARRFRPRRRRGHQGKRVCRPAAGEDRGCAAVCAPLLEEPVANRANYDPRLIAEIKKRELVDIGDRNSPSAAKKNFRWRRPRHTLKAANRAEIERVGSGFSCASQPSGDIVLSIDESEALTHLIGVTFVDLVGVSLASPGEDARSSFEASRLSRRSADGSSAAPRPPINGL